MTKAKEAAVAAKVDTKTFFYNISRLVEGASFLVAAYYNYTTAHQAHSISPFEMKIRVAASLVMAVRGAYEIGRWLVNKEVK
jgi:hypothetical protein